MPSTQAQHVRRRFGRGRMSRHHLSRTVSCSQGQTAAGAVRGPPPVEDAVTGETTARRATAAPTAVMAEGEAAADCPVQDQVTIRMPADGAYLSVLRTATAGLAARLDFTLDEIEDLRIAVDEACGMLL